MSMKNVQVKKPGRKPANPEAFAKIAAVKKGDSIIVLRKDWTIKTPPGQHIIRRHTGREFKVETLADETGWKVTAIS